MGVPVLTAEQHWVCPNCDQTATTRQVGAQRYHACAGLAGFTAPMVEAGVQAKVEAHERDDYEGGELVQRDGNGRPIMSVVTTRDEGQDVAVFAPTARM